MGIIEHQDCKKAKQEFENKGFYEIALQLENSLNYQVLHGSFIPNDKIQQNEPSCIGTLVLAHFNGMGRHYGLGILQNVPKIILYDTKERAKYIPKLQAIKGTNFHGLYQQFQALAQELNITLPNEQKT